MPYLKTGKNPHVLNISPPLNMKPVWFKGHVGKNEMFEMLEESDISNLEI